jgi:hypothetical protein
MKKRLSTLVAGLWLLFQGAHPAAGAGIGLVTGLTGDATVRRQGRSAADLKFKDDVFWRDVLNTGADSRLRLLVLQKSVITMKEQSQLQLLEETVSPTRTKSVVNVLAGSVRTVVEKDALKTTDYEVRTDLAVATIRGSDLITVRASATQSSFYTGPGASAVLTHSNPAIGTVNLPALTLAQVLPTAIQTIPIDINQFRSLAGALAPKGAQTAGHKPEVMMEAVEKKLAAQGAGETIKAFFGPAGALGQQTAKGDVPTIVFGPAPADAPAGAAQPFAGATLPIGAGPGAVPTADAIKGAAALFQVFSIAGLTLPTGDAGTLGGMIAAVGRTSAGGPGVSGASGFVAGPGDFRGPIEGGAFGPGDAPSPGAFGFGWAPGVGPSVGPGSFTFSTLVTPSASVPFTQSFSGTISQSSSTGSTNATSISGSYTGVYVSSPGVNVTGTFSGSGAYTSAVATAAGSFTGTASGVRSGTSAAITSVKFETTSPGFTFIGAGTGTVSSSGVLLSGTIQGAATTASVPGTATITFSQSP